jgi:hypothetical protein
LQGWNSCCVRPEPLLIKDIKVKVNQQKPNNVCPAQMKHNSDKMPIAPMSSQPCSKPNELVAQLRYPHDVNEQNSRMIVAEYHTCKAKKNTPKNYSSIFS